MEKTETLPQNTFTLIKKSFFCFFVPLILLITLKPETAKTEDPAEEIERADRNNYFGVFVGTGITKNRHTDVEGFANWGSPGSSVNYDDSEPVGGIIIGRKIYIDETPIRLELDATIGELSAHSDRIDPKDRDETARSKILWLVTTRAGLEEDIGRVTAFVNGGLALGRVSNSVTDIDFAPGHSPWEDPDDSFKDTSTRLGWVLGLGAEMALDENEDWKMRLDGSYINLGEETYTVNHSGGGRCGPEGPRKPCVYKVDNEVFIVRLAVTRRF